MNTNIINAGVAQVNEARQSAVVTKAKGIILSIESELLNIASHEEANRKDAEALRELEQLDVTYASIVGGTAPSEPNINQQTILKAMEEIHKGRQANVSSRASLLTGNIVSRKESIAAAQKRIEGYRKELGALEVSEVKAAQIIG